MRCEDGSIAVDEHIVQAEHLAHNRMETNDKGTFAGLQALRGVVAMGKPALGEVLSHRTLLRLSYLHAGRRNCHGDHLGILYCHRLSV